MSTPILREYEEVLTRLSGPARWRKLARFMDLAGGLAGSSWAPIAPLSRKPIDEANRCNLRHVAPRTLQKALYVGFSQIGRPLRVVCLGWSHFLSQKRASQGRSHYILATVHRSLINGHICTPISAFYFLLLP